MIGYMVLELDVDVRISTERRLPLYDPEPSYFEHGVSVGRAFSADGLSHFKPRTRRRRDRRR